MKIIRFNSKAFSLVEITISLGIVGFCLLAIFGLLPVGLNTNQASVEQTNASNLATMLTADLRATQKPADISPQYGINIGSGSQTLFFTKEGKMVSPTANQNPFFRAMMNFGTDPNGTTKVRMLITWPALGDTQTSGVPKNYSGTFDAVIAIDRT